MALLMDKSCLWRYAKSKGRLHFEKHDITNMEEIMLDEDIEAKIISDIGDTAESRGKSFDYCYNYFYRTEDLLLDKEKSCNILGMYLASWGMYRGSSFLLKEKSVRYLLRFIEPISKLKRKINPDEPIDVDTYNEKNMEVIENIYTELSKYTEGHEYNTLVTKILLGVFGFVPAFDTYFKAGIKSLPNCKDSFNKLSRGCLGTIKQFYDNNKEDIDQIQKKSFTKCFEDGEPTKVNYTKAKIIDLYFFEIGYRERTKKD
jgi:hypothetical protein